MSILNNILKSRSGLAFKLPQQSYVLKSYWYSSSIYNPTIKFLFDNLLVNEEKAFRVIFEYQNCKVTNLLD